MKILIAFILAAAGAGLYFTAKPRQLPLTITKDSRRAPAEKLAWDCILTSGAPIKNAKPPLVRWIDNPRFLDCGEGRGFLYGSKRLCHRGAFHVASRVVDVAQADGEAPSETALVAELIRAATRLSHTRSDMRAIELECRRQLRAKESEIASPCQQGEKANACPFM